MHPRGCTAAAAAWLRCCRVAPGASGQFRTAHHYWVIILRRLVDGFTKLQRYSRIGDRGASQSRCRVPYGTPVGKDLQGACASLNVDGRNATCARFDPGCMSRESRDAAPVRVFGAGSSLGRWDAQQSQSHSHRGRTRTDAPMRASEIHILVHCCGMTRCPRTPRCRWWWSPQTRGRSRVAAACR
jgi:hypothetical protein